MLSSDINASLVEHRMMTAIVATPPEIPITMGVTVDMSRTGAPHRVWVMFCVATSVSLPHTQLQGQYQPRPSITLHLERTQSVMVAVIAELVQMQAKSVGAHSLCASVLESRHSVCDP
jgi:hypothetical protein